MLSERDLYYVRLIVDVIHAGSNFDFQGFWLENLSISNIFDQFMTTCYISANLTRIQNSYVKLNKRKKSWLRRKKKLDTFTRNETYSTILVL